MYPDHTVHRNTLSPWSSSLLVDLMVHNNSQDENISLLTEVWPCSMSRELSVRPYFGTYLQTSTHSLFWLMYFLPMSKSSEKIHRLTQFKKQTLLPCMLCPYVPFHTQTSHTGTQKWYFLQFVVTPNNHYMISKSWSVARFRLSRKVQLIHCKGSWELRFITAAKHMTL